MDVDGVLTDGGIYYSHRGEELKEFNTKDGYGIVKLQRAGVKVGIISGRASKIVQRRAKELGAVEICRNQENKLEAYTRIRRKLNLVDAEVAYLGDDEPDVPVLRCVGFSAAPADASASVLEEVDYVCRQSGGRGAVREVVDLILKAHS